MKLNLFPHDDFTFCQDDTCVLRKTCKRHLGNYKDRPDILNHPRLSILLIDDPDTCTLYIDGRIR